MTLTTKTCLLALGLAAVAACDADNPLPGDAEPVDAAPPDGAVPDAGGPWAWIYAHNPVEDDKQAIQAPLLHLTDPEGKLTGAYAKVFNCYNEEGGEAIDVTVGGLRVTGKMCHQAQKEVPGEDGTFLQYEPPATDADGEDGFAAVNTYYHINRIHDYFADTLGVEHVKDKQLRALVNIQAYLDLLGLWMGSIQLTAYAPAGTSSLFKLYFGVDLNHGEDTIIFSQDNTASTVDPAYDASVIYHEYTHASFGPTMMLIPTPDIHGVDPTPRGLNEALADYFAASLLDHPVVASYALEPYQMQRDLRRVFACPDHLTGQEHNDGEIAAGALWGMRELLGGPTADQTIWNAVLTFGMSTTFEQAAQTILAEVRDLAPDKEDLVRQLFEARGMLGCVRIKDHVDFTSGEIAYPAPNGQIFPDGTPAFMQFRLPVDATTQQITIEYVPGGDTMMGIPMGGAKGDVWVALKPGSDPITYDYSGGAAASSAQAMLQGEDTGAGYALVLSGTCIQPGQLVFQFINKGTQGGRITKVVISQQATKTSPTDNFDCP